MPIAVTSALVDETHRNCPLAERVDHSAHCVGELASIELQVILSPSLLQVHFTF